jgi:multicopper oxidase
MSPTPLPHLSRRLFLTGAASAALVAACSRPDALIGPRSGAVRSAETRRPRNGGTHEVALTAAVSTVDLGGRNVRTWAYDGQLPGKEIRLTAGQALRARITNQLPAETSVHWHGLAIRNDMDGVPGLTTAPIGAGATSVYEFVVPDPGTYWFHPHSGTQLDRGLYAPLIVEDPAEPGGYDTEWVIVLDDWTDGGVGSDPDTILANLKASGIGGMGGMGGMDMSGSGSGAMGSTGGMTSALLGGDAGDVDYPKYLANGRPPNDPEVLTAKAGQRVRIRIINAAADTAFRFALDQHRMTVTHTDGYPVNLVEVDQILIGMGERYDVTVTLGDGVFQLLAAPEGKTGSARALVRTARGAAPRSGHVPAEMNGQLLDISRLVAATRSRLTERSPDREHTLVLASDMASYRWTINGKTYDRADPLPVHQGERVRLRFQNHSMMWHPMHVHGHTFQLRGRGGTGPRKDTTAVLPMSEVVADLDADNPGQWMVHCHNAYHMEAGMMTRLSYTE